MRGMQGKAGRGPEASEALVSSTPFPHSRILSALLPATHQNLVEACIHSGKPSHETTRRTRRHPRSIRLILDREAGGGHQSPPSIWGRLAESSSPPSPAAAPAPSFFFDAHDAQTFGDPSAPSVDRSTRASLPQRHRTAPDGRPRAVLDSIRFGRVVRRPVCGNACAGDPQRLLPLARLLGPK